MRYYTQTNETVIESLLILYKLLTRIRFQIIVDSKRFKIKKQFRIFFLLPFLVACQTTEVTSVPTSTGNGGNSINNQQDDCCQYVTLTYDSKRCSGFKTAYETYKATNGDFPCLVLDFDEREEYDSTYTISGTGHKEDSLKLEGTKLIGTTFSFSYQYWPKATTSDIEKAISLTYEIDKGLSISSYDASLLTLLQIGNTLKVRYGGNDVLDIAISYDSRYVKVDTLNNFLSSLKEDFLFLA